MAGHREAKRWPWFVWFLLKILGLYNSRRIVRRRRCHFCRLAVLQRRQRARGHSNAFLYPGAAEKEGRHGDESDTDDEPLILVVHVDDESPVIPDVKTSSTDDCKICQSLWWDGKGQYRPYSERDIGVRRWNHPGSTVLSFVWLSVLIALTLFDFVVYLNDNWGKVKRLIPLISFFTFILFYLSSPLLSLVANVLNIVLDRRGRGWGRGLIWYEALGVRYIVKRLQHLELGERGLPYRAYLVLCLLWPCLNGAYHVVINYIYVPSEMDGHVVISLYGGMVGMLVWGAFCYLILLMRLSFQRQLRLEQAFLLRHAGALDVCRRRLAVYVEELGSMCRLVSIWIIGVVALSTWAFTTQICWSYRFISSGIHYSDLAIAFTVLVWSENTMFLFLPLLAVGGMDLDGKWVQLERGINQMRCEAQEAFWDKILAFCKEQSPVTGVKMVTLMLSALGLFLGLHLGDQNLELWKDSQNDAMTNSTTPELPSPL